MRPLVLTLRARPEQRLDLSPLVPHRLAGKTAAEIERIELQTTRTRVLLGDAFRLRMGSADQIRIEHACDRLDQIGQGMVNGEILVAGDVGSQAGRLMAGGHLRIEGSTGPWAASGMRGGTIEITGNTGDRLGGPFGGETTGMRGGVVLVHGNAGARAGDRMRRGTIILGDGAEALSPTFVDCGTHELLVLQLLATFVNTYSGRLASVLRGCRRRLAGDMAVLGKGEIFMPP